ncbi:MAG: phosphoribosylanthranilate isomerase [Chloroflexota bacterium]
MTKVKICGITNLEDALAAVEAGADMLGFIFYEPSPRYVAPEMVREIVANIKNRGADSEEREAKVKNHAPRSTLHALPLFVGVFVNASLATITRILDDCQLDAAQLHGDEPPDLLSQLNGRAYKALRPQSQQDAEDLVKKYLPTKASSLIPHPSSLILHPSSFIPHSSSLILLDAYHPTLYGGTGQVTDWTIAAVLAQSYPILLAGSLTPTNVAEAIRAVRPWGVDVSSGVEAAKGKKDHDKVRAFVKAVKSVKRET